MEKNRIEINLTVFKEEKGDSAERIAQKKQVAEIYADVIKLLSEYSSSRCYVVAPDGSDSLIYYRNRVDEIEVKINQIYDNPALVKFLLFVVRPLKEEICQCSLVLKRWFSVNRNLRFYATPFNIMTEEPKFYKSILKGETCFNLDFYPDFEDLVEYYEYFDKLRQENEKYNFHYTRDDFFQRELIEAAKTLFNDFAYRLIAK